MRSSRLLSILLMLQMRGRMPASRLAAIFEVSVRTIYRDVDALSAAGVPIYAEPGRDGGIALHDGYRTRLTGLTAQEAQALPLAGLKGQAGELGLGAAALAAQAKMAASLPPEQGVRADRAARLFHLDPLPWYHRAEQVEGLPVLAEAVWNDRRVKLDYRGWRGQRRRTVDPLGLVQKGGAWYLVARAGGKPRTFRVSSIAAFEVLDAGFERPARFDLAAYWSAGVAAFEAELASGTATIRISAEGREILRAVHSAAAAAITASARPAQPDGWVEAEMPIETPDYTARQLLRLGTEVEVLQPDTVREAIVAEAQRVAALYAD